MFDVHHTIIGKGSSILAAKWAQHLDEQNFMALRLPTICPCAFPVYLNWAYFGEVDLNLHSTLEEWLCIHNSNAVWHGRESFDASRLIRLYIVADKLEDVKL